MNLLRFPQFDQAFSTSFCGKRLHLAEKSRDSTDLGTICRLCAYGKAGLIFAGCDLRRAGLVQSY
jgi:hypothetical protein